MQNSSLLKHFSNKCKNKHSKPELTGPKTKNYKIIRLHAYTKLLQLKLQIFKVGLSHSRKFFAKLKFSPVMFEKIQPFVCLVF